MQLLREGAIEAGVLCWNVPSLFVINVLGYQIRKALCSPGLLPPLFSTTNVRKVRPSVPASLGRHVALE
jgi:hypothetical protein